ncbi:Dyp-type peroxidase [Tessaracoccus oleiagri]|uniref:Dye decolorizing peroxidase n=1 Tax=Tessaracoccus oleiagri TaxID=686624 RepID=A0A1G9JN13_9ACTN|nr:Dyp-type peroxidase [Tessaracoccus oleiagri]SDL38950.1 dye decolorizing peroxidase [Tessaracoccus oleiagri]
MADVSRRGLFGAGAGAVAGVGLAASVGLARPSAQAEAAGVSGQTYSPFGAHQAGVTTPTPAAARLMALDLRAEVDRAALGRLMRVWSTDIAALMAGRPAAGDTLPDMALGGVSLSVLVGLGPRVFELDGLRQRTPVGFQEIPAMRHDRLTDAYSGGDLLLWISADDFTTVAYAARRLVHDAAPWADLRWSQQGSWRGIGKDGQPATGRNLFGQVDGTGNPRGEALDRAVWSEDGWLTGGTQLVVRRIEMDLDEWDRLIRHEQERAIGRDLATGAPLTGGDEQTPLDFAVLRDGEPVIADNAHSRLAHPDHNRGRTMYRRGLNYADDTGSGLIFCAFQSDISKQFIPVQRVLDDFDALNEWTTAVGSAVFVIPPGMREGGYLAQGLLE